MSTKPRIAVIIGSTRDTRFADKPAAWILDLARQRGDWEVELLDLRDFDLPLLQREELEPLGAEPGPARRRLAEEARHLRRLHLRHRRVQPLDHRRR